MSLTCNTAMSQWLTQKEPVRYTNKLIKKTTQTTKLRYVDPVPFPSLPFH